MFVLYTLLGPRRRSSIAACRGRLPSKRTRPRHPCANRSARSTRSPPCSAWMPSRAASSCSRWSRCGCFRTFSCRRWWQGPSFSGPVCCRRRRTWSPCASPIASASSTRWCSRICRRALLLLCVPFVADLGWVIALLLVRSALSQMDVPTRSSYVMAIVTPRSAPPRRASPRSPRSLASAVVIRSSPTTCWGLSIVGLAASHRRWGQDRL